MADRYWVGGTGSWNSTTKWSTTSGGASGASVPLATDNAIFDANSGLVAGTTITVTTGSTCANLSIVGPSAVGLLNFSITAPFTITGTLSTSSTAGNQRIYFLSATYGVMYDVSIAAFGSISDMDFRDIRITGAGGTLTGTRIGNRGNNSGITFSAPKTVYWNLAGAQNWSANGWAATSGGTPATSNFPLPQDTAVFDNTGSVTGTIILDTAIPYTGTVDMSARTSAMTINAATATTIYGNWKNGSGTSFSAAVTTLTFSGGSTQTISSAGKTFANPITVDNYGGTVQLADALNIGANALTVTNGTFTTNGYAVTASSLSSSNSNVRAINLGASTVTLSGSSFALLGGLNLTFNAGTSTINYTGTTAGTLASPGVTFYNLSFTGTTAITHAINGINTFNNLTFTAPASAGLMGCTFSANQTINGTLTCAGSDAVHRVFLRSATNGTTQTLTVNSLSANDCDFRDITIAGAAAGTSPTRAGDCGGNTGITFPAPKTVYWNLGAISNWSATAWATSSGGTPALNNFPLAQDTAVFDNTGSASTVAIDAAWNIGTLNMSSRTSAMTLTTTVGTTIYGNWTNGTGVSITLGGFTLTFSGKSTQTITSNGVTFTNTSLTVNAPNSTVQLADALTLSATQTLTLTSGTFDAVTYNVTTGAFTCTSGTNTGLKMGSGTWTLSGTGTVWSLPGVPTVFLKGTANIVLSDTSTTARTFGASSVSYNKLTIGGTTGTSTLTFSGAPQFTELASTKTVAHTIIFPSNNTFTVGKWSVTGTAGNVVTLAPGTAATAYTISIAGAAPSGIDYLSISYCTLLATSPAEFFVGANSTNTAGNTNVTFTATPAPRTLYWVGGTGNWSSTTKWSTSSGGASGAAIPTSLDNVIFDTLSNATAYTATVDPTQARCAALTIGAPLTGALTFAGTGGLAIAGNTSIAASNVTRTYTGAITLSGSGSYTLTTNGVALASAVTINGVGSTWTLGGAFTVSSTSGFTITNGTFDTSGYAFTANFISSSNSNSRTINLNASAVTFNTTSAFFTATTNTNLTFNAGTSSITATAVSSVLDGGSSSPSGLTFYNVSFTYATPSTRTISGANTFNNLSFSSITSAGIAPISINANQTINGTLTLSAGTDATMRTFVQSSTLGTPVTLTCNAVAALTDIDFRDITFAGNCISGGNLTGTRLGDCKGNTGVTLSTPKTVYCRIAGSANWSSATGWGNADSGGVVSTIYFPLAQDTAIFQSRPNTGATVTLDAAYNLPTIDMSAHTTNTFTLATGTTTPTIYGNWINGTGTTLSGTGAITFAGRGSQTITSAGVTWTQVVAITTPGGSVTLNDAFTSSNAVANSVSVNNGTFNANNYNFSLTGASSTFSSSNTNIRTINMGSGTWTLAGTGTIWNLSGAGVTLTGSGTISLTSASGKTFLGNSLNYSGITLNQGGAGALTISGNNTFGNITNTYGSTGATTIALGTTTQTVANFTAAGTAGNLLTITGNTSNLIYTGGSRVNVDYLNIQGRAYATTSTWYAGTHSTNSGSLGWIFSAAPTPIASNSNFFLMFG